MKTIAIEFEEYPDPYEITVSPVPLGEFERVWQLHLAAVEAFTQTGATAPLRTLVETFAKVAKPTVKGKPAKLLELDPNLTFAIVRQWHMGVRSVPLPLPQRSSVTGTSPER